MSETSESDLLSEIDIDSNFSLDILTSDEVSNDDHTVKEMQKNFLNMIKMCIVLSVQELLDDHSDFNLNYWYFCKKYQGLTSLILAVEVNCEKMVDLLLFQMGLEISDSLMYAICENHSILIKFLNILQSQFPKGVNVEYKHSIEFLPYLIPFMLVAQCGHSKIISLLGTKTWLYHIIYIYYIVLRT